MSRRPRALVPSASCLHYFGAEVRRLRVAKGLSHRALAEFVLHGQDLVRKIEVAERVPSRAFVERCDAALDAGGALLRLWPIVERERTVRAGRPADGRTDADVADRLVLDWLLADDRAPDVRGPARRSPVQESLDRLRLTDSQEGGGETYPELETHLADIDALAESAPRLAAQLNELAGYDAVDLGADAQAQHHYLQAVRLSITAGDRPYGGYLIGVSLGHLALHRGDPRHALRLSDAAFHGAGRLLTPAVQAALHAVQARAHARLGDEDSCAESLHHLDVAFDRSCTRVEPEWMHYFGEADIADERAHCFFDLGRHAASRREARSALGALDPTRRRRRALDTALLASSYARAGAVERACSVGHEAVSYASCLKSFRSTHRIVLLLALLHGSADHPAVRALTEHVAAALPQPPTLAALTG